MKKNKAEVSIGSVQIFTTKISSDWGWVGFIESKLKFLADCRKKADDEVERRTHNAENYCRTEWRALETIGDSFFYDLSHRSGADSKAQKPIRDVLWDMTKDMGPNYRYGIDDLYIWDKSRLLEWLSWFGDSRARELAIKNIEGCLADSECAKDSTQQYIFVLTGFKTSNFQDATAVKNKLVSLKNDTRIPIYVRNKIEIPGSENSKAPLGSK